MKKIGTIILGVIFLLFSFIALAFNWVSHTWKDITFDQIVFHITNPSQGVDKGLIKSGVLSIVVPLILLVALWGFLCIFFRKKKKLQMITLISLTVLSIGLSIGLFFKIEKQYGIFQYFKNVNSYSTFIGDNYVDPNEVNIVFPENKRNVIYIFMESMEMTYSGQENGGAFETGCINELTNLALSPNNDCFNGQDGLLNGGYDLHGCDWTMGAIVAQTGAIPVLTITQNAMATNTDSFYPNMVAIGNILENEGYNQVFMCGSDAVFGGRAEYLKEHGNYEIFDAIYARENGYVPEDYFVFWGVEDKKLFNFAKEKLEKLGSSDEPFNFTLLTVDTHFEDGYKCEDCTDKYGDKYSNVMACSSKRVMNFIEWCKQQDFYENTTIVICGDHSTMDSDFCEDVANDYQRKVYTCILNSVVEPENNIRREFSTLDMLPTTLAAMGCTFDGNRLGLGTNLYSDVPTLVEKFGVDEINTQFSQNTNYYDRFGRPNPFSYKLLTGSKMVDFSVKYNESNCLFSIAGLENANEPISKIIGKITDSQGNVLLEDEFNQNPDKIYQLSYDFKNTLDVHDLNISVEIFDAMGMENSFYSGGFPKSDCYTGPVSNMSNYINLITSAKDGYIFISVKDEALGSLTNSDVEALNAIGFNVSNESTSRCSYVAIYDANTGKIISEKTSSSPIEIDGNISNIDYHVASAGFKKGNYSNIVIDNNEYSPNARGFNIALVQNNGQVSTSAYCDVYGINAEKKDFTAVPVNFTFSPKADGVTASLVFPNVKNSDGVYIYIWDAEHINFPTQYELNKITDSDDKVTWECHDIDITELDIDETYFSIYFLNNNSGILYKDRFKVN